MKILKEQKTILGDYLAESKADNQRLIDYAGEELAKEFFSLKPRLKAPMNDLYYWLKRPVEELQELVDKMNATQTRKEKEHTARSGAELIAEDDNYKVYHITTFEAAQKYGAHTKWCITGKESGWVRGRTPANKYWVQYTKAGIKFYFFISKKDDHKYAIAYNPKKPDEKEIFDEQDKNLSYIPNISKDLVKKLPFKLSIIMGIFIIDDFTLKGITNKNYHGAITIPNNVKSIGYQAFYDCIKLSSVVIPDSVTSIEERAFSGCSSLKSIVISNSVESVGYRAFSGCSSLKSIVIPDTVTSIEYGAFEDCSSLENVIIPEGVMSISGSTFYRCSSLKNIVIPNSVTSIGNHAFYDCSNLENIVIPDSVTYIGYDAFEGCLNLESIIIPSSLESIDESAFEGCSANIVFKCNKDVEGYIVDELKKYGKVEFTESLIKENLKAHDDINYKGDSIEHFSRSWCTLHNIDELINEAVNSKGVYSLYNGWIKRPTKEDIPEPEDISKEVDSYIKKSKACDTIDKIDNFIDDIYRLRQNALLKDGEFGKGNLIFKELRNKGIINDLKDKKVKLTNKELSL